MRRSRRFPLQQVTMRLESAANKLAARRNKFKGLPALQTTVHHPAPTATELPFIQTLISFERACPQAVTRHGGGLKRND